MWSGVVGCWMVMVTHKDTWTWMEATQDLKYFKKQVLQIFYKKGN